VAADPQPTSLSASPLWASQRQFFVDAGARVWRDGVVPSYVSTNPYLAGFLAEVLAAHAADGVGRVDIVELGAGSGKLGFHVVRALAAQLGYASSLFRYVLTDVAPGMLDFWANHPRLRELIDFGLVDVALFDVERPGPLELRMSGEVLGATPSDGPLAIVASYCLDSVAQDVFFVDEEGGLFECMATYRGPAGKPDEALLSYEMRPCSEAHYGDPALDRLLAEYRTTARGVTLTFPRAALACFEFFAEQWPDGLLALVGDRGFVRPADSLPLSAVEPTRHGSVSLPVNFGAIGGWFAGRGGAGWHPVHHPHSYNVSCFAIGDRGASAGAAYRNAIGSRDPDSFFILKKALQERYADLSLTEAVAFLRFSHWDSDVFAGMFPHLAGRLEGEIDGADQDELRQLVEAVWDNYFPVRDDDVAFMLASVAYAVGDYAGALEFFGRAIEATGGSADCWLNCALCHELLGDREKAVDCVYRALVADPTLPSATDLLKRLRGAG